MGSLYLVELVETAGGGTSHYFHTLGYTLTGHAFFSRDRLRSAPSANYSAPEPAGLVGGVLTENTGSVLELDNRYEDKDTEASPARPLRVWSPGRWRPPRPRVPTNRRRGR